jgi:hypothetical protein
MITDRTVSIYAPTHPGVPQRPRGRMVAPPTAERNPPVTQFEPSDVGMKAFLDHIGEQVRATVDDTVALTNDLPLDTAVNALHHKLNTIPGLEFDRAWAQEAVETLRRGEPLEIQIG